MHNKKSLLLAITALCTLLSSCYSVYPVYKGNVHQSAISQTKNQILRTYGVPGRTSDDGLGGTILVYERSTMTTISNSNSAAYGRSASVGAAVYGSNGVIGASQTQAGAISLTNGISQTSLFTEYCYLFLNKDNVVYDFKTNYGALYDYRKCYDKVSTWTCVGLSCFLVYPAVVSVPWAILAQRNAKKKGEICK
jgi:hypothetical protein